jgi:hypothetical protein
MSSYIKVDVAGLTAPVDSATFTFYTYSSGLTGVQIWAADSDWTETGITWNNAPRPATGVTTVKPLTSGTTVSADVSSIVTGNGTYTFVITTTSTNGRTFASREAGANPPSLVLDTAGGEPSAPTIVAAGDIACPSGKSPTANTCQQKATSDLAVSLNPAAVLPLGDDQYEQGSLDDFRAVYDGSWGRLNTIAHPVPGNHEYGYFGSSIVPTGGQGYFTYFGDRARPLSPGCTTLCTSWYSWNLGDWHLVALDSQCSVVGGCAPGDPQYEWLSADLAANTARCTLAYWHVPLHTSGAASSAQMRPIYRLLYTMKADVVLTGHAHYYERFTPQDADGNVDATNGIRDFVVGTGGRSFFALSSTPAPNSVARIANTFGVLEMRLSADGYSWNFVPANDGGLTDAGSGTCH